MNVLIMAIYSCVAIIAGYLAACIILKDPEKPVRDAVLEIKWFKILYLICGFIIAGLLI